MLVKDDFFWFFGGLVLLSGGGVSKYAMVCHALSQLFTRGVGCGLVAIFPLTSYLRSNVIVPLHRI